MAKKDTTAPTRMKKYYERMREKGFARVCVWAHPEDAERIRKYAAKLQNKRGGTEPAG